MTVRVIRAAAGCGKTTALATAYLELLASGVEVDRIIAITFTRRAAAELVERVGMALRAAAGDARAAARLGAAGPAYLAAAPSDPSVAEAALAGLGSAPIGTTDHFVNLLLAEFALHAELDLPDGRQLPLDVGLVAVPSLAQHLDAAARRVLDPPDREPPDEVAVLTRYFSLAEILELVCASSELDGMPSHSCADVLQLLSVRVAEKLTGLEPALFGVEGPTPEDWYRALEPITLPGAGWTVRAMASWFADGAVASAAPRELVSWSRKVDGRSRVGKALKARFRDARIDFGITDVRMDHVLAALRHPYEDPAHLVLADELRAAVETLRVQVASEAVETAALQGELPHVQMTRAATRLARSPVTHGRFGALLVDEVQDADPDQLALYLALAAHPEMKSAFVGDARQSIYLFRGGEPAGLARLTELAGQDGVEPRLRNFRSTPPLVEAHRALFAALDEPMRRQCFEPLESLEDLQFEPGLARAELDPAHHDDPRPVWLVSSDAFLQQEVDDRALVAFWQRLQAAWKEPGHEQDTAAVLCPTWARAQSAADLIRRLAEDEEAAWVEGGDRWLQEGVGKDVALWLRALLDPTDAIAWLAVWKHPSIGLTDGALARIRNGVGVIGIERSAVTLGHLVRTDGLESPHRSCDIDAVHRALPPLRRALERIGRDDTAEVLDELFHTLHWRLVLGAGPQGSDEQAHLEVLLDWIGEQDAAGASVDVLSQMLSADQRVDMPRVRLTRGRRTVTCTTVFQSKGLAWDHVAVVSPGRAGRLQVDPDDVWVDLGRGQHRLTGLDFDPEGGLMPFQDPLRRLCHTIRKARFAEEGARLAYVAVTRARRSVTVALPKKVKANDSFMADAQKLIANAWRNIRHPAVALVDAPSIPATGDLPTHQVAPRGSELPTILPVPEPLHEIAPSAAAARYSRSAREAIAEHVRTRAALQGGFVPGGADVPPPKASRPDFSPADWGTLAHGWFAAWGFRSPPDDAAVQAYLEHEWGADQADVRSWLLAISARMQGERGSLWELVTDPASRLFFEYPLLGVGGAEDDLLLGGRIDLLVARKKGLYVIDFKAGDKSPTTAGDLVERASLKTYGPQLDSYRGALGRMGHRVLQTSLWFVRTGAQVSW